MPSKDLYSEALGPELSRRVSDFLLRAHDSQVNLYEEVAIARSAAMEALRLSQPLYDSRAAKLSEETKALMIATVGSAK